MNTQNINLSPETNDITPQDIMRMEGFRHFTEEQATEVLQVIDTFCEIAYSIWSKQEKLRATESQTIPLTSQHYKQAA